MNYVLSMYSIISKLGLKDSIAVYNVFTKALILGGNIYKRVLKQNNFINTLKYPFLKVEEIKKLNNLGVIVDSSLDEKKVTKEKILEVIKDSSKINLTLLLTLDCNMDCSYCYEKENRNKAYMDLSTCNKILQYFVYLLDYSSSKKISVTIYGGEPLLNIDAIKYLLPRIKQSAIKKKIILNVDLITNGILLSLNLLNQLKQYGLNSVQITLDGCEEVNDSRRYFKNGKGTFNKIFSNLIETADCLPTTLRINLDSNNVDKITRFLDILRKFELHRKIILRPAFVFSPKYSCNNLIENTNNLLFFWKKASERNFIIPFDLFSLLPVCSIYKNYDLVIGPLGEIYKCIGFAGNKKFIIGHIDEFKHQVENYPFKPQSLIIRDKCVSCKYWPLCLSGCRMLAYIKFGSLESIYCQKEFFDAIFEHLLPLYISQNYDVNLQNFASSS